MHRASTPGNKRKNNAATGIAADAATAELKGNAVAANGRRVARNAEGGRRSVLCRALDFVPVACRPSAVFPGPFPPWKASGVAAVRAEKKAPMVVAVGG
ncbi:unnamed protein product [Lampetra fluviatilis]